MIKPIRIFNTWLICGKRFYHKVDAENYIKSNDIYQYSLKETNQLRKKLYEAVKFYEKRGYIVDKYKFEMFNAVYWLKYWNFKSNLYLRIDKLLKGK